MKLKLVLALVPAVCLFWPATSIHAQKTSAASTSPASTQNLPVTDSARATSRIAGVLKDPSGAVIAGEKVELSSLDSKCWSQIAHS